MMYYGSYVLLFIYTGIIYAYIYICVYVCVCMCVVRDSAVSSDSLRGGRSGDRILVEARFSAPIQTGPGAYTASYSMGTRSFPGVNRLVRGVDHPLPSSTEVKERVDLYIYSHYGPSWPLLW